MLCVSVQMKTLAGQKNLAAHLLNRKGKKKQLKEKQKGILPSQDESLML